MNDRWYRIQKITKGGNNCEKTDCITAGDCRVIVAECLRR